MKGLRAIDRARLGRPTCHGEIDAALLARCTAREELIHKHTIFHCGNEFLDPHDRDIDWWHGGDHAPVALIGHNTDCASLSNGKITATDAHIGGEKFFTQSVTGDVAHFRWIEGGWHVQFPLEDFADILDPLMDDGGDDMAGWLVGKLDDIFTQVGLYRLDPKPLQRAIEVNLLSDH